MVELVLDNCFRVRGPNHEHGGHGHSSEGFRYQTHRYGDYGSASPSDGVEQSSFDVRGLDSEYVSFFLWSNLLQKKKKTFRAREYDDLDWSDLSKKYLNEFIGLVTFE